MVEPLPAPASRHSVAGSPGCSQRRHGRGRRSVPFHASPFTQQVRKRNQASIHLWVRSVSRTERPAPGAEIAEKSPVFPVGKGPKKRLFGREKPVRLVLKSFGNRASVLAATGRCFGRGNDGVETQQVVSQNAPADSAGSSHASEAAGWDPDESEVEHLVGVPTRFRSSTGKSGRRVPRWPFANTLVGRPAVPCRSDGNSWRVFASGG